MMMAMKKIGFLFAVLAMVGVACNQPQEIEEVTTPEVSSNGKVKLELKVTIDPETKATMEGKTLTFGQNDIITVLGTYNGVTKPCFLTVQSIEGGVITFSTEIEEGTEIGEYAYYPQDLIVPNGSETMDPLTILWPDRYYTSQGGVLIPMMAKIDTQNKTAVFKHLGAMLKVTLEDVPAGNDWLEFKTSQNFVGRYTVNPTDWSLTLIPDESNLNSEVLQASADGVYYIPVPPGSYADFQLAMRSSDQYAFPAYYNKQRTANLSSPITPARTQIVNLGKFKYDIDEIAEWWHVSPMNGWDNRWNRYIKTGANTYMLIAFNQGSNPTWKLLDGDGNPWRTDNNTAWTGVISKRSGSDNTFTRTGAENKTFWVTLSQDGDTWNYNSGNWDNNAAEWGEGTSVELRGSFNNWQAGNVVLSKYVSYDANYSFHYYGLSIPDNAEYTFKFVAIRNGNETWYGGSNVNLTDSVPYASVSETGGDDMKLRLTPGLYDVYIDMAGRNFMFVKQPNSNQ